MTGYNANERSWCQDGDGWSREIYVQNTLQVTLANKGTCRKNRSIGKCPHSSNIVELDKRTRTERGVAMNEKLNCHGCKWLDRYKKDGNGYCCMVDNSKTQPSKIRRPDTERCELYEFGDWATRYTAKPYIVYFFIKENRKEYLADVVIEAASAKEACARCKEWYFKKTGKNAFRPTTSISDETQKWYAEHDRLAILNINK